MYSKKPLHKHNFSYSFIETLGFCNVVSEHNSLYVFTSLEHESDMRDTMQIIMDNAIDDTCYKFPCSITGDAVAEDKRKFPQLKLDFEADQ